MSCVFYTNLMFDTNALGIVFFVIMLRVEIRNIFDCEVRLLLAITYLINTCVDTHECLEIPPYMTMMCGIKGWKIVNKC